MIITLQEIKDYLRITDTANDTMLTTFGGYVQGEVEAYCQRKFDLATYTDEVLHYMTSDFDAQPNPELDTYEGNLKILLKQYPVVSVSSFTHDTTTLTANTDYLIDLDLGEVEMVTFYSDADNDLKIDYIAGYSDAPDELKMVILEGVKDMFKDFDAVTAGGKEVKSKSVGDFSVTYSDDLISVNGKMMKPYMAKNIAILDTYKKWAF